MLSFKFYRSQLCAVLSSTHHLHALYVLDMSRAVRCDVVPTIVGLPH